MNETRHILVVDDERDIADLLQYNLQKSGYRVSVARNGRSAVDLAISSSPDAIILDVMLPELSGTEVARRLRTNPVTATVPILMLTAKGEEVDQVVGLTVGADDYVTKPFSIKVLLARLEALLRRSSPTGNAAPSTTRSLSLGDLSLNTETHEAGVGSDAVKFTLTEFRLLAALLQAQGKIMTRSVLMSRAMGPGVTVTDRTIDVHMTSIRKKLGSAATLIKTVRGVGYRATADAPGSGEE
jgi:two-component system phosphate regulon response regulator PhoB